MNKKFVYQVGNNKKVIYVINRGHAVAQLVEALRRKVAGSIPVVVNGIFQ